MKLCVITRADNNIKSMTDITHPLIKRYSEKCGADFKILSDNNDLHPHYRILQIKDLFDEYSRILCIDSDILLTDKLSNIFDIVPVDQIGVVLEDKFSRLEDRRNRIKKIQEQRGNINWTEGYINTGFILFSRTHKDIFDNIDTSNLWLDLGYDDVEIGFWINKLGHKIYELPCEYNFMNMFLETGKSRADAFCLHYAGQGFTTLLSRDQQIKQDYLLFKRYGLIT